MKTNLIALFSSFFLFFNMCYASDVREISFSPSQSQTMLSAKESDGAIFIFLLNQSNRKITIASIPSDRFNFIDGLDEIKLRKALVDLNPHLTSQTVHILKTAIEKNLIRSSLQNSSQWMELNSIPSL